MPRPPVRVVEHAPGGRAILPHDSACLGLRWRLWRARRCARGWGGRWGGRCAAQPALPVPWRATPGWGVASSLWPGGRLPTPAGPPPAGHDAGHTAVAPLGTPRPCPGRTRPVALRATDARVCPTARPTPAPGPTAAAPRRSHWPARRRHTRRGSVPGPVPRSALQGLAPVADRRWPGSRRLPAQRPPRTAVERHGRRPASGASGAWTSRSRRRTGASGTCRRSVRPGSARLTRGGHSGAGPAYTPHPSRGPPTAW